MQSNYTLRYWRYILLLIPLLYLMSGDAFAQLPIAYDAGAKKFKVDGAETYVQTFDRTSSNNIPNSNYAWYNLKSWTRWVNGNGVNTNSTIPHWYFSADGYYVSSFYILGNDGNTTSAGVFSYGKNNENDRAIGGRGGLEWFTNKQVDMVYMAVRMKNTSDKIIKDFLLSYTIEQWYYDGDQTNVELQYAIGPNVFDANSTNVDWKTIHIGKSPILNGATVGHRTSPTTVDFKNLQTAPDPGVNLAPNQEITFRWIVKFGNGTTTSTKFNGLALDDIKIKPTGVGSASDLNNKDTAQPSQTVYYNKADKKLDEIEGWGMNPDGTGTRPRNFTDPNQTFIIKNFKQDWYSWWLLNRYTNDDDDDDDDDDDRDSDNLRENSKTLKIKSKNGWVVTGNESKIIIGDGINPVKVSIEKDKFIVGTLDLAANATLVINTEKKDDDDDEKRYGTLVPTFGDLDPTSTVVYADSTDLDINAGVTYGNLVVLGNQYSKDKNRNAFAVSAPIAVKGALRLDGKKLKLSDNTLTINLGGTVENVSKDSYIVATGNGRVTRKLPAVATDVFDFSVGTETDYAPVKIKGGSKPVSYKVGVKSLVPSNVTNHSGTINHKAVANKSWVIEKEQLADGSPTTSVTLQWNDTGNNVDASYTVENIFVGRYNAAKAKWELKKATGFVKNVMTNTYEVTFNDDFATNGVAPLSIVTNPQEAMKASHTSKAVAATPYESNEVTVFAGPPSNNDPLPVELVSFGATTRNGSIQLAWKTATEKNNSHFDVEVSTDGKKFEKVGEVKGKGNSSVASAYTFPHDPQATGVVFYRLKQVDFDGSATFSKVIAVEVSEGRKTNAMLAPNPTHGATTLFLPPLTHGGKLTVYNIGGKIISQQTIPAGTRQVTLSLEGQPAGTYLVRLQSDNHVSTLKLIKF